MAHFTSFNTQYTIVVDKAVQVQTRPFSIFEHKTVARNSDLPSVPSIESILFLAREDQLNSRIDKSLPLTSFIKPKPVDYSY